ncbi:hypothetical protein [Caldimonas aquatica]|uniref:Uncharacterized protein n=1 Tax=Caldimonas aquatica TaxID=376175 RepID=A0ABY6MUY8_9BURK|nr:hypothetical protein [Schlegelella aquatica]UZD55825.1 hypothetical protein OMP39_04385 [Schlegelella aquatica]
MEFEMTFRLIFGDRAKCIEGQQQIAKSRVMWLRKALSKIESELAALDTTERHKQMLLGELEAAREAVDARQEVQWSLVYSLLRLVGRLLGYDFVRGAKCHTATYWQTVPQNLNSVVFQGGDIMQDYYDKKNAIAIRREVVAHLKKQGLSDYRVALVLNTTEHEIKKLKNEPIGEASAA